MRARSWKFVLLCALLLGGAGAAETAHAEEAPAKSAAPQKNKGPNLETLVKGLDADEPEKVEASIVALSELNDPRAGKALALRIKRGLPPQLVEGAIDALVKLKAVHATPVLLELAQHRRWQIRQKALSALAELHVKSSQSTLLYALDDPSAEVRSAAALSLSRIGDARALNALRLAFERGVEGADVALAKLGSAREVELLLAQAKEKDFGVARNALLTLLSRKDLGEAQKRLVLTAARDLGTEHAMSWLRDARAQLVSEKNTRLLAALDQLAPPVAGDQPAVIAVREGAK